MENGDLIRNNSYNLYCLLLFLIFFNITLWGERSNGESQLKTNQRITMNEDYTVLFADTRRSSFLSVTATSIGEIEWSVPLSKERNKVFNPKSVLSCGESVIVFSDSQIVAFSSTGQRLWGREKVFGSSVSVFDGKLYFRGAASEEDELNAVFCNGQNVEEQMIILDSYEHAFPIYIEPLADGLIAMCAYRVGIEDGPPEVVFYKKDYASEDYRWVSGIETTPPLLPLHIKEMNRFIVFTPEQTLVYNSAPVEVEEELQRFQHPLPKLLECSASESGILYFLGIEEKNLMLVAVSLNGEELWRCPDLPYTGYTTHLQPPIIGIDGLLHVAAGTTLSTVRNGDIIRKFLTKGEAISFVTALGDGTLLISAGRTLYQIDSKGEILFEILFEDEIKTPPIVDRGGKIYLASATNIIKIR